MLQFGSAIYGRTRHDHFSIAANTVVGMFWLTSQLQAFGLSGDACPTRLTPSDNTSGLLDTKNDLLVVYSDGTIPGWETTRLLEDEMVPMTSPVLAAALASDKGSSFAQYRNANCPPLLNYLRSAPDWVDWRVWFSAVSLKGPEGWPVKTMSTYSQTIGEAIRGNGIALGSIALLHSELKAGRLVPLSKDVLRSAKGYYLCHSKNAPLSGDARRLADFLIAAAKEQRTETPPV